MMPIINGTRLQKKEIKAEINIETYEKIDKYCAWAKINDLGSFIEEAAAYIFAKDREWKQYKKATKKHTAADKASI